MYIDVDLDSHSVVSLSGDKDTEKQYMMSAVQFFGALLATGPFALIVLVAAILALGVVEIIDLNKRMWENYMDYMFTGNMDSASSTARFMSTLGNIALAEVSVTQLELNSHRGHQYRQCQQ